MNLEWLGMFSDRKIDAERISPLDAMGNLMFEKLAYAEGELDLLVLYHDFRAVYPDGSRERIVSRMIDFGLEGGDSSMARTVSLPAAIATHMILNGSITETGVLRPVLPGIYNPVLDELAEMDIVCEEHTEAF
jgi:saccharopine dehydrogenase-like NADP-dependent oxidoreductase